LSSPAPSATFRELGLAPELLRAVEEEGYTVATPIQVQAIPVVLEGKDVMGGAQTGTGKTAAFALPILQRLIPHASTSFSPARHPIRALILTPTRELAVQVEESFRVYGKHVALRSVAVYGGVDIDPQTEALRKGVEILVATPGRLLDHMQQRTLSLATVQVLVLDEADRMLDMGFLPDLRRILVTLPPQRQNLLFSATFPAEVKKLAESMLRAPVSIQVAQRNSAADLVRQVVYPVRGSDKRALLMRLLRSRKVGQSLIFVNTKLGASRLAKDLARHGFKAEAIHSDRNQLERMQTLDAFKSGDTELLVATDVAARGLDIEELPTVFNFDIPNNAEDYIHRIGRTGRAGTEGDAISLVAPEEERQLADIERLTKRKINRESPPAESSPVSQTAGASRRVHSPLPAPSPARTGSLLTGSDKASDAEIPGPIAPRRRREPQVAALLGGLKKTVKTL
jgi:ATP-dependent RNA helicase RhlE